MSQVRDETTEADPAAIAHLDAPLVGEALERYRETYRQLWGNEYRALYPVTRADHEHLSDLLLAALGRGHEVNFR